MYRQTGSYVRRKRAIRAVAEIILPAFDLIERLIDVALDQRG